MTEFSHLFDKEISIQCILYILREMGGKCDIHKCHKILYFADNEHLSRYACSITGDRYIKMEWGPVPTCIYDLFKAVRGNSYFASSVDDIRKTKFRFINNKDIISLCQPDMDYLSESNIEMLNKYIKALRNKSFDEISSVSHGYAWSHSPMNGEISLRDRLTEMGDSYDYIEFVEEQLRAEEALAF